MKSFENIQRVVVVGAGVMGEGIAQSFIEAGLTVCLVDIQQDALDRCKSQILANLKLGKQYGVIAESPGDVMARITTALSTHLDVQLENCDLAIETGPEVLTIKKDLFSSFDKAPAHVLIASNTSSFTVSQMTQDMHTPERVVGLHYFNPAHLIPAVEVHFGKHTSQQSVDTAVALMKHIGKIPVLVRKEIPGFIINRLTGALSREIDYLLDEGIVAPHDLDAAVKASLGFRLAQIGPMEGKDFIGLDTDVRVSKNVFPGLSNRTEPSLFARGLVEDGHYGVKTGRGVYDYSGRSREELLHDRNVKLLKQRQVFISEKDQTL